MSGSTHALVVDGNTSDAWDRVPDFATSSTVYITVKSAMAWQAAICRIPSK
ncbi:MAG: hypothetical protein Q8K57_04205 [Thiobacillus sp.]|nr:hypothetical protein [Gammaproteobacteria bacterium]MDP1923971.1 hypothetical protein [Thiobacillus sp.]